jgi:hypothetical protein
MTNIPASFVAGDTVQWTDGAFDGKGSSTYTLTYALRGESSLNVTGVPTADGWAVTMTAAQTNELPSGDYAWHAYLTSGSNRYTVGSGVVKIEPNIALQSAGFDARSQIEQDLAAIEAEIRARATGGATIEYSIGNRSLKKESISALLSLRSALRTDLAREKQAKRLSEGVGRSIGIRFGR